MVRTLIAITDREKEWLDHYSHQHHQSRAETVRKAIEYFREYIPKNSYQETVKKTAGLWKDKKINGLKYVENLRKEWQERSRG